jgi:hypothetical protein
MTEIGIIRELPAGAMGDNRTSMFRLLWLNVFAVHVTAAIHVADDSSWDPSPRITARNWSKTFRLWCSASIDQAVLPHEILAQRAQDQ